jgi:Ca-activated chloride channel family protein
LNETLLQQIATKSGGFYLPLVGANPMQALYEKGLEPLPKSDSTTKLVRNYREQFRWPLALAILILIVEMFLPQRRRIGKTDEILAATNPSLKTALTIFVLLFPLLSFGSPTSAFKKYEAGKFDESLTDYKKLLAKNTNDFRLQYNAGDAAYKAQQFDAAKKHFDIAAQSPDLKLQQHSFYNLGNTLYQIGEAESDAKAKRETWESAIHNFENALKLNPQDADAKQNLAFVKQKLEELKKQQQRQNQKNKQDQNKGEKQDEQQQNEKNQEQNQDNQQEQAKNDQENKNQDQQQKQDSSQQSQKQNDEKSQEQQQQNAQQDQSKPEKQDQQQAKDERGEQPKPQREKGEEQQAQAAQAGQPVQMTPQQAMQFLKQQEQQDRTLIFTPPPDQKPRNQNRAFKDW